MRLSDATANYVAHKQSMGMRFCTEARILKSFCRAMGEVAMHEVKPNRVLAYLAGAGPVTRFWQRKHEALSGFYRFAIARGYAIHSPLPRTVPRPVQSFVPYVYSREELRRLIDATLAIDKPRSSTDPDTYRTLLLVLYGAGLRISEALALTVADVDLTDGILHIRESKFYKTRLVPLQNAPSGLQPGRLAIFPFPPRRCGDAAGGRDHLSSPTRPRRRPTRRRLPPTPAAPARFATRIRDSQARILVSQRS